MDCYQTSWSYMASMGHMECVEHHWIQWSNSRLHNAHQSSSCSSFLPPQGRSCSQSGQDRGQSIFQNLHSVHQQCCSMISKKVVLAGGCRSPSPSLSTSLPPSPSSWQKEDWEPDFLEAALISLEVKVGGVGGGGSGGIATWR